MYYYILLKMAYFNPLKGATWLTKDADYCHDDQWNTHSFWLLDTFRLSYLLFHHL